MNFLISRLKIMMKTCYCMLLFALMAVGTANAQHMLSDNDQKEKIRSLISQVTLKEKVSLLHGNSKFYVSGVKRLGIRNWP